MGALKFYLTNLFISAVGSLIGTVVVQKFNKGPFTVRLALAFLIIIFGATLITSEIYKDRKKNTQLEQYRADFLVLRTDFESLPSCNIDSLANDQTNILIHQELSEGIPNLTKKISLIQDYELDEGYIVLKYDLLCYMEAMYSELINDIPAKFEHVDKGLHYYELAKQMIEWIEKKAEDDDYLREVIIWIQQDHAKERLELLKCWLLAIKYKVDGISPVECEEITNLLSHIPAFYLRRNSLRKNPSLKYFIHCNES